MINAKFEDSSYRIGYLILHDSTGTMQDCSFICLIKTASTSVIAQIKTALVRFTYKIQVEINGKKTEHFLLTWSYGFVLFLF